MIQNLPVIKNLSPARRAIAVTVGLLVLYELVRNIPLAFLFSNNGFSSLEPQGNYSSRFHFLSLGIVPALTGFFLVEICSFFLPPLKNWRMDGTKGRNKLTKCALIVSLLIASQNAYGITLALGAMRTPDGEPFLGDPSLLHQGLFGFTLLLGFVVIYGLAVLITRHGIGNGFVIIIAYGILRTMPRDAFQDSDKTLALGQRNILTAESPNLVGMLLFIFIIVVLYQKFGHRIPETYRKFRTVKLKGQAKGKPIDFQLPYLPQGVFSLLWPYSFVAYLSFFMYAQELRSTLIEPESWTYLIVYTVLLPLTSFLGYFLISHPDRIAHNTLGKVTFQENWDYIVDRNALRSITIITIVWFLWNVPYVLLEGEFILYDLIDIISLIILTAMVTDLVSEYRFLKEAGNPRILQTFDNVHYVTYLKGLFEAEGIRFCVQAFEYRRLFYFFEPLIKMRVMVDARDWDKANQLADLEKVTII